MFAVTFSITMLMNILSYMFGRDTKWQKSLEKFGMKVESVYFCNGKTFY